MDSRAYITRRIARLDAQIVERRGYVGPVWPSGFLVRVGPGRNVDDLLELRAKWQQLYDSSTRVSSGE
jgi:hypothetical protein